jgi:deoxyribose-phosphate aldolase
MDSAIPPSFFSSYENDFAGSKSMQDIVRDLAKMIDHSLLHPTLTDAELYAGCEIAVKYETASVCVKPYSVFLASQILRGAGVAVGTVVGFPHGNSPVKVKAYETVQACGDGTAEVDMVVNIGKVLGGDWAYVEREIKTILDACHAGGAILKVIFENAYIPDKETKIRLCEICSECRVEFIKTSTGYGFVRNPDGTYSAGGAVDDDICLMREHAAPWVQVKAAGGVRTLDDMLRVKALGVTRVGATATAAILDEAAVRFA